ncbi:MAG TPA: class I SAM-dependent methyltransferase [Longimicrobium sp.]|nr:class I SAM-dependent methyltransferase [Longimicrobium sp.]
MIDGADEAVLREYARLAGEYDRRWARYLAASVALLRPALAGRELGDVLDVGCGTGLVLRALAECDATVRRYAGADPAAEMLAVAAERARGIAIPHDFVAAPAEALPFDPASFDTAVSASSLHYWTAPERALDGIRRALRPGGRFVLLDWCRDSPAMKTMNAAMRLRRIPYHHMWSTAELRALLEGAGFRVGGVAHGRAGGGWRLVRIEARLPDPPRGD